MIFTKPWATMPSEAGREVRIPLLDVYFRTSSGGFVREAFVVDSGADVSLGPRHLCDLIGLRWESGKQVTLRGISPKDECSIAAALHQVEIHVREAACRIIVPFCFADGDAPLLLGREGFFDAFRILLDKRTSLTTFEW